MTKDAKSDAKGDEMVQLVAMERGFMDSKMVEPGTKFSWPADRKVPKWAKPAGTPLPVKRVAGDLKPKETQEAVKKKAGELSAGIV